MNTRLEPDQSPNGVQLLSPEAAARELGISRSFVYELMKSGRLRSVKIGKLRRIPRQAISAFVDELSELRPL